MVRVRSVSGQRQALAFVLGLALVGGGCGIDRASSPDPATAAKADRDSPTPAARGEVLSLEVQCPSTMLPEGKAMSCTVTGTRQDGSVVDLTADRSLTWQLTSDSCGPVGTSATISKAAPTAGKLTAELGREGCAVELRGIYNAGVGTLTSATVKVQIVADPLAPGMVSVAVECPSQTLPEEQAMSCVATGTRQDSSVVDLTAHPSLIWQLTSDSCGPVGTSATISKVAPTAGQLTAELGREGCAVELRGIYNAGAGTLTSATVKVQIVADPQAPGVVSFIVECPSPALAEGQTMSCTATGTRQDGGVVDLTTVPQLTWQVANDSCGPATTNQQSYSAVVSDIAPTEGQLTAMADRSGCAIDVVAIYSTSAMTLVTPNVTVSIVEPSQP